MSKQIDHMIIIAMLIIINLVKQAWTLTFYHNKVIKIVITWEWSISKKIPKLNIIEYCTNKYLLGAINSTILLVLAFLKTHTNMHTHTHAIQPSPCGKQQRLKIYFEFKPMPACLKTFKHEALYITSTVTISV